MLSLEISSIGSACGKNPYEPRDKTIFTQLCKEQSSFYKKILIEQGIIIKNNTDHKEKEFKEIYKNFKQDVCCPEDFDNLEKKIVSEFKKKEPQVEMDNLIKKLRSDLKKDCGINNEKKIISTKNYKKGNNKLWIYKDSLGWELKGFHDASDGEIVIEVKTRMRKNTVRKNNYDLYQLFGYLLAMNKTKGKIVQMFNKEIFDSDIETDIEYGIVDITSERYSKDFEKFKKELNEFFEEVYYFKDKFFNFIPIFERLNSPIAEYSDSGACNILPGFERIVKLLL